MRILLDTHILIWHLEGDEQLSLDRRLQITDPANSIFISIASFWEIAIKSSRGRLSLAKPIEDVFAEIARSTASTVSIEPIHTLKVSLLPFHHKDPFDRMIIAQALVEEMQLMSSDGNLVVYGVEML